MEYAIKILYLISFTLTSFGLIVALIIIKKKDYQLKEKEDIIDIKTNQLNRANEILEHNGIYLDKLNNDVMPKLSNKEVDDKLQKTLELMKELQNKLNDYNEFINFRLDDKQFEKLFDELTGKTYEDKFEYLQYINRKTKKVKKYPKDDTKLPEPCQDGIDVVYLWVNGSDPEFIKDLRKYKNIRADTNGRYRETNTLFYSLRSIYEYAPYIKNYYIVTKSQTPSFINTKKLKYGDYTLTIVDHKDIFKDLSALPVFNSNAIEFNIHRIKGLKKCFLYLNDDMMLGAPTSPSYWAKDGKIIVGKSSWSAPKKPRESPDHIWHQLMGNTNTKANIALKLDENTSHNYPCHNCYFFDREVLENAEKLMEKDFLEVSKHKFRQRDDLEYALLHNIFALETNKGVPGFCENQYYLHFEENEGNDDEIKKIPDLKANCFCINDSLGGDKSKADLEILKLSIALELKLPNPSPFENDVLFEDEP